METESYVTTGGRQPEPNGFNTSCIFLVVVFFTHILTHPFNLHSIVFHVLLIESQLGMGQYCWTVSVHRPKGN